VTQVAERCFLRPQDAAKIYRQPVKVDGEMKWLMDGWSIRAFRMAVGSAYPTPYCAIATKKKDGVTCVFNTEDVSIDACVEKAAAKLRRGDPFDEIAAAGGAARG
jgi:hypothetical protein